ncbi:hypothetical protein Sjap_021795 [Stephania japonica]|uniref:Uncharacterized protein n=1 Tax=Stephania japonica TaxID=461633 RepID=A0AAP0HPA8_9MAGN
MCKCRLVKMLAHFVDNMSDIWTSEGEVLKGTNNTLIFRFINKFVVFRLSRGFKSSRSG